MPMPDGAGRQVVNGIELSYGLSPKSPRAGAFETLELIARDYKTRAIVAITPTLEVAPAGAVDGVLFACKPSAGDRWRCPGVFFTAAGEWRMRVRVRGRVS